MKTRDTAVQLRALADFLDARPEFETEGHVFVFTQYSTINFYDRDKFITAVKSLGSSKKSYTEGEYSKLMVTADAFPIKLSIARDAVCKKIVKFECEPLFSEDEVEAL